MTSFLFRGKKNSLSNYFHIIRRIWDNEVKEGEHVRKGKEAKQLTGLGHWKGELSFFCSQKLLNT